MAGSQVFRSFLVRVYIYACCGALMSGCAVGNRYSYRDVVAVVPAATGKSVAVATHDQRQYVVAGDKQPNFVGIQRGGFGNPFNVSNSHNEPLSTSYSTAVCNSLKAAGASCLVVETDHNEPSSSVARKVSGADQERALMFTLREWKTDALMSTALLYDVTLEVLSQDGRVLASKVMRGKDDLDGSFWNGPRHARKATPVAFKSKIEAMLSSPDIQAAIGGTSLSRVAEARPVADVTKSRKICSVAQILQMKQIGLSEAQIESSCE
jgi:hypothetical protein